jgi:hypothetical protein
VARVPRHQTVGATLNRRGEDGSISRVDEPGEAANRLELGLTSDFRRHCREEAFNQVQQVRSPPRDGPPQLFENLPG